MLRVIQEFFNTRIQAAVSEPAQAVAERSLELATAALLIEVSRADYKVEASERRTIEGAVQSAFALTPEETQELIVLAETEVRESISLYEFTRLIDRSLSLEQKKHIVELLWRVAFSDAEMEANEEYLIRKIAKLLHVAHQDFIDAKIRARETRGRAPADGRPR